MKKKYEFTGITMEVRSSVAPYDLINLHQIKATKEFTTISGDVIKPGDIGGWIENTKCLSRKGRCWAGRSAYVYDNGRVCDNAYVTRSSIIGSVISGEAYVTSSMCVRSKISEKTYIENSRIVDEHINGVAKIYKGNIEGHSVQSYITMGPFFDEYYITFYKGKDGTILVHANKYIGTASGFIRYLRSLSFRNRKMITYNKQEVKIFRSAVKTSRLILSGYSDKYKSFLSSHIVVNELRSKDIDEDE